VALTSTVDRSFDQLTKDFNERSSGLLQKFDAIQGRFDAVLGATDGEVESLVANLGKLQRAVETVQTVSKHVEQLVPQLEEAIARQVDQQTRDINEAITSYTTRLSDSVERQDMILETGVGKISGAVENLKDSIPSLNDALSSHLERHTKAVEGLSSHFAALSAIRDQLASLDAIQEQLHVLSDITTALQPLEGQGADVAALRKDLRTLGEAIAVIRGEVTGANAALQGHGPALERLLEALRDGRDDHRPVHPGNAVPVTPGVQAPVTSDDLPGAAVGSGDGPRPSQHQPPPSPPQHQAPPAGAKPGPPPKRKNLWQRWFGGSS
jgi:chromosome segregation ATPase